MPYDLLLICFFFTILSKSISKIVQSYFVITVAKKFDIPTLDLKVYDDSKTEIDDEVFQFLVKSQDLGVLEICLSVNPNPDGELSLILINTLLPIWTCSELGLDNM